MHMAYIKTTEISRCKYIHMFKQNTDNTDSWNKLVTIFFSTVSPWSENLSNLALLWEATAQLSKVRVRARHALYRMWSQEFKKQH